MGNLLALTLFALPVTLPSHQVSIKGKGHTVYITVDDHPNMTTSRVLKVLKQCRVTATFFVVGYPETQYQKYRHYWKNKLLHQYLLQIKADGHTVGNHGVTHRNLCKLSRRGYQWELRTTQTLVSKLIGSIRYWRPPFLARCTRVDRYAKSLGLTLVMAHIGDIGRSAQNMWQQLQRRATRHSSSIILFHKPASRIRTFLKLAGLCPP